MEIFELIFFFNNAKGVGGVAGMALNREKLRIIPHICQFFTHAKFLESKIYTEKRVNYTVNC